MASAVVEARRVLKTGGLLLDLHPTDEPTSLQIWHARYSAARASSPRARAVAHQDGAPPDDLTEAPENLEAIRCVPVGELDHDESLRDFTATSDALADALADGGFDLYRSTTFDYRYFFDSLDELTEYLEDNWEHATASDALLERALMTMAQATTTPKIVIVQRAVVTALRKI